MQYEKKGSHLSHFLNFMYPMYQKWKPLSLGSTLSGFLHRCMTSNFMCLSFSTLRSSELIPSLLVVLKIRIAPRNHRVRPRETSLPSVNILSCNLHEIRCCKNLHNKNESSIGKCPTNSWLCVLLN